MALSPGRTAPRSGPPCRRRAPQRRRRALFQQRGRCSLQRLSQARLSSGRCAPPQRRRHVLLQGGRNFLQRSPRHGRGPYLRQCYSRGLLANSSGSTVSQCVRATVPAFSPRCPSPCSSLLPMADLHCATCSLSLAANACFTATHAVARPSLVPCFTGRHLPVAPPFPPHQCRARALSPCRSRCNHAGSAPSRAGRQPSFYSVHASLAASFHARWCPTLQTGRCPIPHPRRAKPHLHRGSRASLPCARLPSHQPSSPRHIRGL